MIKHSNQCASSKPFLQKPVNLYDDWVYLGKETYGSRQVSGPAKFSTKFFDVLGRAYDKMKANIKYYVLKEAIENKRKVALEFEVYMRIIEDSDGNDVRVFVKEDKANGLRRDSSFYADGSWEVMEKDNVARTIRSKTSLGVKSITEYDNTWHINKLYITDKNNYIIAMEQYIWEKGRLMKIIRDGLERIFIYGKTLQDTVKVIPSDVGIYFHPGYNNSVGIIPDENDPMYEYFAMNPYGGIYVSNDNYDKKFLGKLTSYQFPVEKNDINKNPTFINPNRKECFLPICPENHEQNGITRYALLLNENGIDEVPLCEYDISSCKYKINYKTNFVIVQFDIIQSILKLNTRTNKLERWCRTKKEIQDTYDHEHAHILNVNKHIGIIIASQEQQLRKSYDTEKECNTSRDDIMKTIRIKFGAHLTLESWHSPLIGSPQPTGEKIGEICDDIK